MLRVGPWLRKTGSRRKLSRVHGAIGRWTRSTNRRKCQSYEELQGRERAGVDRHGPGGGDAQASRTVVPRVPPGRTAGCGVPGPGGAVADPGDRRAHGAHHVRDRASASAPGRSRAITVRRGGPRRRLTGTYLAPRRQGLGTLPQEALACDRGCAPGHGDGSVFVTETPSAPGFSMARTRVAPSAADRSKRSLPRALPRSCRPARPVTTSNAAPVAASTRRYGTLRNHFISCASDDSRRPCSAPEPGRPPVAAGTGEPYIGGP